MGNCYGDVTGNLFQYFLENLKLMNALGFLEDFGQNVSEINKH